MDPARTVAAFQQVRELLLRSRNDCGWWTGCLSTSALSTATAVMALTKAAAASKNEAEIARWQRLTQAGVDWLARNQNTDGGWGDTTKSLSNISTSMLAYAVFHLASDGGREHRHQSWREAWRRSRDYVERAGGVAAVLQRYGKDRTFSVPILTHCALAGIVDWKSVIPLPFELSCIPHRYYAAVSMPVVSYALPALIAIGQVIFRHQGHWNPLVRWIRRRAIARSLRVLETIQPEHGGFLEATPLTSFVGMSLIGCDLLEHPVTRRCLQFIEASVREDGSWPIDTNLATWVTTLSVNALSGSESRNVADRSGEPDREILRGWLLGQQYRNVHPYTQAAPGGWSWTDLPGGVPDADDTPGAMLALLNLRGSGERYGEAERSALGAAVEWLLGLQNRDGGWPTFCRGWGALPFDRSSSDLTAHVLRAFGLWEQRLGAEDAGLLRRVQRARRAGIGFLLREQRSDGTWLPLWFGNQHNQDDENPLYGTTRVLRALVTSGPQAELAVARAVNWLLQNQNDDGGWSARRGITSTVEETALAVECLAGIAGAEAATDRGAAWLTESIETGKVTGPSPIGFYFAKLWYFEELYPVIFTVSGLNRWNLVRNGSDSTKIPLSSASVPGSPGQFG